MSEQHPFQCPGTAWAKSLNGTFAISGIYLYKSQEGGIYIVLGIYLLNKHIDT